jgi:hypothetical protein
MSPALGRSWHRCGSGEPSAGAGVPAVGQPRCTCGSESSRGTDVAMEPSRGANVAAASLVPGADVAAVATVSPAEVQTWYLRV